MMHGMELWKSFWKSLPVFCWPLVSVPAWLQLWTLLCQSGVTLGANSQEKFHKTKVWEQNSPSPEPPPVSAPEKQLPLSADLNRISCLKAQNNRV